jgi:signal transduction histidine kinase
MTAAPQTAIRHAQGRASRTGLEEESRPAIAIDLDASEIVAANASGAEALGLFPYASFPIALDPVTPALVRLRELAAKGEVDRGEIETLNFWSRGRLRPISCTVAHPRDAGSKTLLLRVADEPPCEPVAPDSALAETTPNAAMPESNPLPVQRKPVSVLDPDHLAKLAHELKTPLTAIAAAAEIMRDERLGKMKNERYRNYAADIHESATHALDVIASLLSESGKPSAPVSRLIALDLNAIVERTVSSLQALAQSRGINLACDIESSRPHVVANPTALRQSLLNLLTNAIKFTPRDGDVRVVTGYLPDGRVFVVVRDTGCGMTGTNGATTEPSATGDTRLDASRGNGIGLPLVRRLVAEMGAELEIESAPGKGTAALIAFAAF